MLSAARLTHQHLLTTCHSVGFEACQIRRQTDATCEYKPYKHPHTQLHPHSCSSPPRLYPALLLSAWLCEPVALYLFSSLFNIQFIFSSQGTEQGAEVFHQSSLVVFGVLCLPKVPGLYLDSQENMGTITR